MLKLRKLLHLVAGLREVLLVLLCIGLMLVLGNHFRHRLIGVVPVNTRIRALLRLFLSPPSFGCCFRPADSHLQDILVVLREDGQLVDLVVDVPLGLLDLLHVLCRLGGFLEKLLRVDDFLLFFGVPELLFKRREVELIGGLELGYSMAVSWSKRVTLRLDLVRAILAGRKILAVSLHFLYLSGGLVPELTA